MAVQYLTTHTDEHGTKYAATRTSRMHTSQQYTHAFWVKGAGGWTCGGYARNYVNARNQAARYQRSGYEAAAVTLVQAIVKK